MTIRELAKHEGIKTARPRTDMILVRDLRNWAKAKIDRLDKPQSIVESSIVWWIRHNFNLVDYEQKDVGRYVDKASGRAEQKQ